jgi:hypothetical protein
MALLVCLLALWLDRGMAERFAVCLPYTLLFSLPYENKTTLETTLEIMHFGMLSKRVKTRRKV